jgi:hypothetical protein
VNQAVISQGTLIIAWPAIVVLLAIRIPFYETSQSGARTIEDLIQVIRRYGEQSAVSS